MPVPVAMLARRIVIVGAGVAKQRASEKKEDQFTLPESRAVAARVFAD
jgi:hypothetical protein